MPKDIPLITYWSRIEGFAPGFGDLTIYRHTDSQGLWVGCINKKPIGCIAGVRYNSLYGFLGLFIVVKEERGKGYGINLWKHALEHLSDIPCVGLEAAIDRVDDYSRWGFIPSSFTTRWKIDADYLEYEEQFDEIYGYEGLRLLLGNKIPESIVQAYDAKREPSPRPHFLADWLTHPSGQVLALLGRNNSCHGFGRIRPCLMQDGEDGWRIGPLIADTPYLAEFLLRRLILRHKGEILIDSPGINDNAGRLMKKLNFDYVSQTLRMYKGHQPPISMNDVYSLACLELG